MDMNITKFIIVDDDPVNNLICKKVIMNVIPNASVKTFTQPESGLAYILATYSLDNVGKTILLLDINMPSMNGWEFMDQFERASTCVKDQISAYILSSSLSLDDKEKAGTYKNIVDYLEKPLSTTILQSISES